MKVLEPIQDENFERSKTQVPSLSFMQMVDSDNSSDCFPSHGLKRISSKMQVMQRKLATLKHQIRVLVSENLDWIHELKRDEMQEKRKNCAQEQ